VTISVKVGKPSVYVTSHWGRLSLAILRE